MLNLLLSFLAVLMFIIIEPISFVYVIFIKKRPTWKRMSGYYLDLAVNIDRFGNYQFRSLFNAILIHDNGYRFGDFRETISSVLGKNKQQNTLSKLGRVLDRILDVIDKNHSVKSIKEL